MEFDKKKLSFFIIALIAVIMLSRYYLQIFTLGLSLVFLWYSAKKKNAFLLTLGLLGLFIATLVHQRLHGSREGFQDANTSVAESKIVSTHKSKVPKKDCNDESKSVTRITVAELTKLEYMFNVFFGISSKKSRRIFKNNCIENIFDAMISSDKYKKLDESEQIASNWHIRDGIMDKIRDLYHIYNFSIQNLNIIIIKNILDFSKIADGKFIISEYGIDSIHKLSLDYFLQNKKFVDKQFKILEFLDIISNDKKGKKIEKKIRGLKPAELYYNQRIKELCSLMVCFEKYNIITSNDLKTGYPSGDLNGDKWVIQTLEQVKLDDFNINTDSLFKKYNIKNLIIEKLKKNEEEKTEEIKSKLVDFSKPGSLLFEQLDNQDSFEINRGLQNSEIKEYEKFIVNNSTDESTETKKAFTELADVNKIRDNTVGTLNSIVDDTRKLITDVGEYKPSDKTMKGYFEKYIKLFTGFVDILVREQRAFFVGIILIVLSIITNFIEVTRN